MALGNGKDADNYIIKTLPFSANKGTVFFWAYFPLIILISMNIIATDVRVIISSFF